MRNVKIGCPGYILREELEKDFSGTVKRIHEIGYDGIEITGFFGKSAGELRQACDEARLQAYGCFAIPSDMLCEPPAGELREWSKLNPIMKTQGETPDQVMEYIRAIGCEYIGLCVSSAFPTEGLFDQINRAAALAKKHGMKLQYHNHNYEYTNMADGEYRMDYVLRHVSEEVLFEPDLGWMAIGGYDPMRALEKYQNRIEIVHLKDYYRAGAAKLDQTQPFRFRPTGYGVMDWASILPWCEEHIRPVWYVADHDSAYDGDIYKELELSLHYIRNKLSFV